jgi:hypothetical protein
MINHELLRKLPIDIIVNNIIPYTYVKKNPFHLQDIRSFYSHFSLVENYYYIYHNQNVLYNDLEFFFYRNHEMYSITNQYYKILRRHFSFQDMQYITISNYVYTKFQHDITNANNKIKFIWGLLTPSERIEFINKHVIG